MDPKIAALTQRKIFVGTSSWKYTGWKGLIYRKEYSSEKAFNHSCLEEYAEHYSTVGIDHTFYHWPTRSTFDTYLQQTPEGFLFGLKATERITIFQYPKLRRYGKHAGMANEDFLNSSLFLEEFLPPLENFRTRLGAILFEFSHFYPGTIVNGQEFVDRLDRFFSDLRKAQPSIPLGVEIRNGNWLQGPYFKMLTKHRVSHVFNSWTKMPSIGEQLEAAASFRPESFLSRVLLQPGTKYETAVEAFSPYDKVVSESPSVRREVALLIERALELGVPAFVFVNNRCEGSAPFTIQGILENLSVDLKGQT